MKTLRMRSALSFLLSSLLFVWTLGGEATANNNNNTHNRKTNKKIAFGSCHKNLKATVPSIWNTILNEEQPDSWIWTGDATYPSSRDPITGKKRYGPAPPSELQQLLEELKSNATIGYSDFLEQVPHIYGTWDDHDYGGNDMGEEIPMKRERQDIFWEFLGYRPHTTEGTYHSVDLGSHNNIQLLLLDTRSFRQAHCIPSVAHVLPMGNAIACVTRWLTAGLYLHKLAWLWGMGGCEHHQMLGDAQWTWLEEALLNKSSAKVHIVVSSVQVWTTNPAMESWGHFPKEQERLYRLLERHYANGGAPVIFLSGDVHSAEVLGQPGFLEITSSGLTHHCGQPRGYGQLCRPILETFTQHRYPTKDSYYIGLNYGVIEMLAPGDGDAITTIRVLVKNAQGETVLQVEQALDDDVPITLPPFEDLPKTWNGHLLPWLQRFVVAILLAIGIAKRVLRNTP
jgi:alkaline phosphatase D